VRCLRLAALAALATVTACSAPAGGTLVLVGATLIDGTGKPPLKDALVVVEGGHIKAVGHQSRVSLPKGARVFDARGKFIVPQPGRLHPGAAAPALAERVRAGIEPLQALAELSAGGTIEPGRPADLLILDQDPLLSPENLGSAFRVMTAGRLDPPP
jgi:imidazolonepropionase-like amidohydrolase